VNELEKKMPQKVTKRKIHNFRETSLNQVKYVNKFIIFADIRDARQVIKKRRDCVSSMHMEWVKRERK
jgi:hypothetical protein